MEGKVGEVEGTGGLGRGRWILDVLGSGKLHVVNMATIILKRVLGKQSPGSECEKG